MPFLELKQELASSLAKVIAHPEWDTPAVFKSLEVPPNPELGHLAFPCFRLAKALRKAPPEIAKTLMSGLIDGVEASVAGPYLNFKFSPQILFQKTIEACAKNPAKFGADDLGHGKKVVIEYCSPNIAKRLMFQHIRSILIGNTLSNVYAYLGFQTVRMNFVGDWGTQFAKLLVAIELWGDKSRLDPKDSVTAMAHLLELYVRFHKECTTDATLEPKASQTLQLLEKKEPKATALWKMIRDISLDTVEKTLKRMNTRFDVVEGESQYIDAIDTTLNEVKQRANAKLSEGALIVELDGITTPALIQKKDGTTLYLTRDVAAAADRKARYQFDKSIYIVGNQQQLHFQQLFGVLKKMGYPWTAQCEHVGFGTVLFGQERMSTREGRVIFLDDVLDEAVSLALKECTEKNPALENKPAIAEKVGLAAVVFGELSAHRQRDIEFDWKHVIAFDGETGPYVQYATVRTKSLLEKAGLSKPTATFVNLPTDHQFAPEEVALLLQLSSLRPTLHQVLAENEPYHLSRFLIETAKAFNRFYYHCPVLQAEDEKKKAIRLALVELTSHVLQNGLALLGVQAPEQM